MKFTVTDISNDYPSAPEWRWMSSYIVRGEEKKKVSGLYHLLYKNDNECTIEIVNESLKQQISSDRYYIKVVNHMMYLVDKPIERSKKLNKI